MAVLLLPVALYAKAFGPHAVFAKDILLINPARIPQRLKTRS